MFANSKGKSGRAATVSAPSLSSPRPADWPDDGPLSLTAHDLPHASSTTEWWYVNSHLRADDGRELSVFAAFFRILQSQDPHTGTRQWAHSLTWAVSDVKDGRYLSVSRVDAAAPTIGLEKIKQGHGSKDGRLNRAMTELLEKGRVPRPDRVFGGPVTVALDRLALDFGGTRFEKLASGAYQVTLDDGEGLVCQLAFQPKKAPVLHGDRGVVRGVHGEDMFYYFIPRCEVTGELTLDGQRAALSGQGWYDHEFGCPPAQQATKSAHAGDAHIAWDWLSAQLDDGTDVSVYQLVDTRSGKGAGHWAVVSRPDGGREGYTDFQLETERPWRSVRTFQDYPTRWQLEIPAAQLSLRAEAAFADQELVTVLSKPAFWEGRVDCKGTLEGRAVAGPGYVERNGFSEVETLDDFFARVGEEVRKSVMRLYPLELSPKHAANLVGDAKRPQVIDGVDLPQLSRTLIEPVRTITDRGGKSWRSYAALACCDVVLGDSRKFAEWLAMPEFIHVGSLIVDDVEDGSTVRRGGPTAHLVHGEPLAINAGTAAYFMGERLLRRSLVSPENQLKLYDLYFEAMRAGHAGQAIDLDGLSGAVPDAVERGQIEALEARVMAVHRLKTAVPAASLSRMGAVAGGGTEAQIEAIGYYFESVGLAFQIIDDVLNLRGFKGNLKTKAEDISHGKVTLPFVKTLGVLDRPARADFASRWMAKPTEPRELAALVQIVEGAGALDACVKQAADLVEDAWRALDPVVEDSLAKIMLRAFGWYVLERHY